MYKQRNHELSIKRIKRLKERIKGKKLGLSTHVLEKLPDRFDNKIYKLYAILISCLDTLHYSAKRKIYMCANSEYYFVLTHNFIITAVKKDKKTY